MPHRGFLEPMQPRLHEVEDLLVPKPGGRPPVHFQWAGLEEQQVAPVLESGYVAVERLPLVGDDRHPAAGPELLGNSLALQGRGFGIPTHPFDRLPFALPLTIPTSPT